MQHGFQGEANDRPRSTQVNPDTDQPLKDRKRVNPEIGTEAVRVVRSSPHKGNAEILKAEKVKSGGTDGGCSGGIGEAGRLSQRQVISAALSGGCLQFARVGNIAGI